MLIASKCRVHKDIKVSDLFHFSTIKVEVRHLDHLFRIYIKSMGKDTVCRVEESKCPEKPAIEFINEVFNAAECLQPRGYCHAEDNDNNNILKIKPVFAGAAISGLFAIFYDKNDDDYLSKEYPR